MNSHRNHSPLQAKEGLVIYRLLKLCLHAILHRIIGTMPESASPPSQAPSAASSQTGFTESEREVSIPVSVILQRTIDRSKKWVLPQWKVFAVVAGEHISQNVLDNDQPLLIHDDGIHSRYFRGGMVLHLYKDGTEGYWYNLLSDPPYLFVVCDGEQGDREVEAAFITANQDEANGYMESDRLVLSAPMPAKICDFVERYVISHYRPKTRKKRERREWTEESIYAKRPRQER